MLQHIVRLPRPVIFNPAQTNSMHFFSLLQVLAMCLELILTLHGYFLLPCMLRFKVDGPNDLVRTKLQEGKSSGLTSLCAGACHIL